MRIFVCAGEPSGDLHGANLIRALRERFPAAEFYGFGGDHMEAAGCELIYPMSRVAVMWFARVLAKAPFFLSMISKADRLFRHRRPDAVVLIDFPGFNWWMARRAHFHGIPVFYFVPPQIWAWMSWRVKKMRRWVDHVLCTLPFEKKWYEERGVQAHYVGHPYFDELSLQTLDSDFVTGQKQRAGDIVGLLPGSRSQEITRNLTTLVRTAVNVHRRRPQTRFLVACYREAHKETFDAYLRKKYPHLPVETHVGRTPEIIELSRACVAVSGSVGLELFYRLKPACIVYRISRLDLAVGRRFIRSPFISLVNLLAEKELYPEFLTDHCEAKAIAEHVLRWLGEARASEAIRRELAELKERVALPGACDRTAEYIASVLRGALAA